MTTSANWIPYRPRVRVGKLCYHYCSSHSRLPVRDVLNSHRHGYKVEPNYETATYNWCARCNQPSVAAAVKDGLSHLLFITRYTGANAQYRGRAVIVGYYEIGEVTAGAQRTAVRARKMCFVGVENACPYPVGNLRWATQRITGDRLEEILAHLNAHDATEEYLREVSLLKARYNPYSTTPAGRIFIINVGANTASRWQSLLFADGRFEFTPIREEYPSYSSDFLTLADLKQFYAPERPLMNLFPQMSASGKMPVHDDPEFATLTYGDNVRHKRSLLELQEGDFLFFLARLVPYAGRFHPKKAIFALIGYLEIAERIDSLAEVRPDFSRNAHVLRWRADPVSFDDFAIFKGSANSRRFHYAVPFDRAVVEGVPLLAANGEPWNWEQTTELGVIGSYMRAVRMHVNPSTEQGGEQADRFWQRIWRSQKWVNA